jgi:mono/diheme cytochrome c family protein
MTRWALVAALLACACATHADRSGGPVTSSAGATPRDAERGEDLFRTRGCAGCHSIGEGPRVGPDLAELLERREPEWIVAMITRPDSMLRHDAIARDLGAKYAASMPRLGIAPEEASALLAYIGTEESVEAEDSESYPCPRPRCGHGRHGARGMRGRR